jgi:hypothetical protein
MIGQRIKKRNQRLNLRGEVFTSSAQGYGELVKISITCPLNKK